MLTTVRHIFGRIMHSETALHSQWDKGRKNNLLFASPSIRRPTVTPGLFSVSGVYDGIRQMFLVIFYGNKDDTFVTIKKCQMH